MKKSKVIPVAFSAPAQLNLYERYGDPRIQGWEEKWLMPWDIQKDFSWFPQRSAVIHKDFRPLLKNVFEQLEFKGLHTEIKTFDGLFSQRPVRGGRSALSVHSWGAAIDLNAKQNPLGTAGIWTKAFIETMCYNHIYCGQNWNGRKDPMHFAMVNG